MTSTSSPKQRHIDEDEERQGRMERGDESDGGDNNNNPHVPFREEEEEDDDVDPRDDNNSIDEESRGRRQKQQISMNHHHQPKIDDDDKDNVIPPLTGTTTAATEERPPQSLFESHREANADREVLAATAAAHTARIEVEESTTVTLRGIDNDENIALAPPKNIPFSSSATNDGLAGVVDATAAATTTTTTTTSSMVAGLSREELERQFLSMEGELQAVIDENQILRRDQQPPSQSLCSQLIFAFLAGLFGVAPPLFIDVDAVLRWTGWSSFGCFCCQNRSGDNGPAGGNLSLTREAVHEEEEEEDGSESGDNNDRKSLLKRFLHRIRKNLRLPFYVFVSLLDFADAILDITVSARALLEDYSEVDDDRVVKGWALVLFCGTILARLLGGLFGVVYHRIDNKVDREFSYFLVEMVIFALEDSAAIAYLLVKRERGDEPNQLEWVSFCLTIICGFVFSIPLWCQHKRLRKQLPRYVDEFGTGCVIIGAFICLGTKKRLVAGSIFNTIYCVGYPISITYWMFCLSGWSRSLYQKDRSIKLTRPFDWSRSLYEKYRSRTTATPSQTQQIPAGNDPPS